MKSRILKKLKSVPLNHHINLPHPSFLPTHHHDDDDDDDKENRTIPSPTCAAADTTTTIKKPAVTKTSFSRPRLASPTLFDPDLLTAFHAAVADFYHRPTSEATTTAAADEDGPLQEYQERCPPGGRDLVVLYTTSLRGVRKTFDDCTRVKLLLGSLKVVFYERDVSMHHAFREELWRVLGGGRVIPPRLFVRGRYVGGAEEVLGLHEVGRLLPLLRGVQHRGDEERRCAACGGLHFLPCHQCHGSRKRKAGEKEEGRCDRCNENGLVVCSLCSCRC